MNKLHRFWITGCLLGAALIVAQSALALTASYSGNIASGAQYDLYTVDLVEGEQASATLVCDEIAPNDRPLDPVLSVYFPGVDPSDLINANVYNDDGFGNDDSPDGVDCNAFDSSFLSFTAPVTGTYTFRADGFGNQTGPYTLTIVTTMPLSAEHPFTDGRLNPHQQATAVVYCHENRSDIYAVNSASEGVFAFSVSAEEVASATGGDVIANGSGITVSLTHEGQLALVSPLANGKSYLFIWNGCPAAASSTYTIDPAFPNPVLLETRSY